MCLNKVKQTLHGNLLLSVKKQISFKVTATLKYQRWSAAYGCFSRASPDPTTLNRPPRRKNRSGVKRRGGVSPLGDRNGGGPAM